MDLAGERITIWLEGGSADTEIKPADIFHQIDKSAIIALDIIDCARRFIPYIQRSAKTTWVDIHDYDGNVELQTWDIERGLLGSFIGQPVTL